MRFAVAAYKSLKKRGKKTLYKRDGKINCKAKSKQKSEKLKYICFYL